MDRDLVMRGQRAVLARIAQGATLREVLTGVAEYAELCTPTMLASILYYEPATGRLRRGGHHTLPDAFADAVDGLEPGPGAASCGTAAFRRERVVSFDVKVDPLWGAFRDFAALHGIRSAWSTPLLSSSDGSLLGVFGMYYPDTREPSPADLELVDHFTHLAAIAIERQRRDDALRESERQRHQGLLATVAGLAHELNTPLGVALTAESLFTEELDAMRGRAPDSDVESLAATAALMRTNLAQAAELLRSFRGSVLEQSFDAARTFDPAAHVRGVVEALTPLTDARGLRIALTITGAAPLAVRCAPGRLAQVINNLVVNAATHAYGPAGGPLTITVGPATVDPDKVEIVVRDEGVGMGAEQRRRCFEPFYTTRRLEGGAGRGLFIVKHIVEHELGGKLLLDSDVGRGARWTIIVPRAKADGADRAS